jgi:hypothetical protein
MRVLEAKIVTTNNYFCKENLNFKGYICPSIECEFHMLSELSIRNKGGI